MKRRKALKSVGALISVGLAGCTEQTTTKRSTGESTVNQTGSPTPWSTIHSATKDVAKQSSEATPASIGSIDIANQDDSPPSYPGLLSVTVESSTIREEQPARLKISCINESDSRQDFTFGFGPPFSRIHSEKRPGFLLVDPVFLSDEDETASYELSPCWQRETDIEMIAPDVQQQVSLEPGEEVTRQKQIWQEHRPEDDMCLLTGDFRFESDEYVLKDGQRFSWGFTMTVSG